MEKLKLVKPTIEYKSQAKEYIDEFYKYNSRINGVGGLDRFLKNSTYEEWLLKIENDEKMNMQNQQKQNFIYTHKKIIS